ncbi:glycoside hydrolase family 27 protein [Marinoscillum sp. 108]|uniref:glycoside hydrolase family 27 protein n=1 Tax=Marinoscillum sp. 108 TaxID=2653151 RepID=UPI0012F2282E|nr:glycoside hydrolase family 27 protein [Marinoscillum sp. 108]VXD14021.1 Alpha-galactosidase A [Marinoscillum sp. 108]
MKTTLSIIFTLSVFLAGAQKFDGLALTPPMGWNSWNKFSCDVTESLIRETADAMVASGLKDAGYEYIVIDDCWHGERDSLGFIQPDPVRFPSGIKALADYIHSKGLKFGIYSDAGWQTCGGRPGSRGREYQDAQRYASWGVDYLKYDWCNTEGLKAEGAYLTMRDALYEAGRPIVLSICEWGDNQPWEWAGPIGHLWRTTGDIYNCFDCEYNHGTWSSWGVLQILDMRKDIRKYAGPDHWNDPDMMEIGNGMTVNEDRAHFSLWAMMAAPLIAGNDLRNMSPETIAILTNKEVIAIDQDTLGIQAFKHIDDENFEVWVKPLAKGDLAVCFLNRAVEPLDLNFDWKSNPMKDPDFDYTFDFTRNTYDLLNVWSGKQQGTTKKVLKASIPGHDVLMFRLSAN